MTPNSADDTRAAKRQAFGAAVTSSASNLLVIAPPGCGKTELLARRARHLINTLLPHQRILALTFSNKAKANLNARLVDVLGVERKRRYVTVRNFHGHAAEALRSHGRTLGLDPAFIVPNKRTQNEAIDPYLDGLSDGEAAKLGERIETDLRVPKQRPYTDDQVLAWLRDYGHEAALEIELARQTAGTPHYDDLLRHGQRLLRVPEIARLYRRHYGAVLVDEFQDLSLQQLDLALRTCDRNRTFVGDPLQGIYSWAGARPVQVERLLRRVCGEPEGLGVSYRSSPNVLRLLNTVSTARGGQSLEAVDPSAWHDGGIAAGVAFHTGEQEAEFIVDTSRSILKRQPDATLGVICRSGWRRRPLDAAFSQCDLPTFRWDLAIDDPSVVDLLRTCADKLGGEVDLVTLREEILSRLAAADAETTAEVLEALEQLAGLVIKAGSVRFALAQLRDPEDESPIAPGVHLLNAHVGKGQQFDWVFVPGFEEGNIPSFLAGERPAEIQEEQRVLLVMLSRARHGVVLTRSETLVSKAGRLYSPGKSRWIAELSAGLSAERDGLSAHIAALPR